MSPGGIPWAKSGAVWRRPDGRAPRPGRPRRAESGSACRVSRWAREWWCRRPRLIGPVRHEPLRLGGRVDAVEGEDVTGWPASAERSGRGGMVPSATLARSVGLISKSPCPRSGLRLDVHRFEPRSAGRLQARILPGRSDHLGVHVTVERLRHRTPGIGGGAQLRQEDGQGTRVPRPPGSRRRSRSTRQLNASEAAALLPFLQRHVELAAPEVLLVLGDLAAKTALGSSDVARLRGAWFDYACGTKSVRAILSPGLGNLMKTPVFKRRAWRDLRAVASVLK